MAGKGFAHVKDIGADWLGNEFYHRDPAICKFNLEQKKKEEEKKNSEKQSIN